MEVFSAQNGTHRWVGWPTHDVIAGGSVIPSSFQGKASLDAT
jgi:hypothetical protein